MSVSSSVKPGDIYIRQKPNRPKKYPDVKKLNETHKKPQWSRPK